MSLLQLPPELLLAILGGLGSAFFAQDVRRLTVCKRWHDLAWTVLVQDLRFTAESLRQFTGNDAANSRSQPYINTVQIYFGGHGGPMLPTAGGDNRFVPLSDDDEWASRLQSAVVKLAATLRRCPRLRSLEFISRSLEIQPRQYLSAKPLADLLSVSNLTSLVFDTASCYIQHRYYSETNPNDTHLCRSINALLPSLRRLHCRMNMVCESLLKLPPDDTPLALEELIINCSISELSDTRTAYNRPSLCMYHYDPRDYGLPKATRNLPIELVMERQATALAARLRSPRMVRVITHRLPTLDIFAFDAIEGRYVKLPNNQDWVAEGEVEEEEGSESEDTDDLFEDEPPITPVIAW
jgi:hypothetical protein